MKFTEHCPGVVTTRYAPPSIKFKNNEKHPSYIFDMTSKKWFLNAWRALDFGYVPPKKTPRDILAEGLTHYQYSALVRLLAQDVLLAQWDVGMGKSRLALEASKIYGGHTLILAPRMMVDGGWQAQIDRWSPSKTYWLQKTSKPAPEVQPDICVVSYDSLHHVPEAWSFDFIVLDELHHLLHESSARSKKVTAFIERFPKAARLGLTATPFGTALHDIQAQLNVLCPNGFGYAGVWKDYFHTWDESGYEGRKKYFGLKPEKIQEFIEYVSPICDIRTTADAAGMLPKIHWSIRWLEGPPGKLQTPESLSNWTKNNQGLASHRATQAPGIADAPTAYVCYLHDTAETLAAAIGIPCVSGKLTPKARFKILDSAPAVVCTMRSINEGIDLRRFTQVYVVELYPVPRYMTQVLGRFARLGATEDVNITFLPLKNTADEIIAPRLLDRLAAQSQALATGDISVGLKDLLEIKEDDESFLASLRESVLAITDVEDHDEEDETD